MSNGNSISFSFMVDTIEPGNVECSIVGENGERCGRVYVPATGKIKVAIDKYAPHVHSFGNMVLAIHFINEYLNPIKEDYQVMFTSEEQKEIANRWGVSIEQMIEYVKNGSVTFLHYAAGIGKIELVKSLIESGGNVNVTDGCGRTPLHVSIYHDRGHDDYKNNIEVSKYLVAKGADVMAIDSIGRTPLLFASGELREVLLAPTLATGDPQRCIWAAATYHLWDVVKQWLERDPSLISVTGRANINYFDHQGGCGIAEGVTLLHLAAERPNIDVLKYLVSLGADVFAKDDDGKAPLDIADSEEKKNILREAMETIELANESITA